MSDNPKLTREEFMETDSIIWPQQPHQHQYTIPVEWAKGSTSTTTKVTKLRCSCGEELAR